MAKPDCISWIVGNFNCIFWIVALVFSVFYAWWAFDVFGVSKEGKPWAWKAHTIWFNLAGSLVGWLALRVLIRRYSAYILGGPGTVDPNWSDLFVGFIAFVGITGYLPYTVSGIISSVYLIASKAYDLLKTSLEKLLGINKT